MYHYRTFSLELSSDVALPLPSFPPGKSDVAVRLMHPDVQAGPPLHMDCAFHITPRFATLDYAHVGTFTVVEGREIRITLTPGADTSVLPYYLIGAVLAVLLYQRGLIVLRASAVCIHGRAVIFISDLDGGKSALAATLCQRGHSLLSDTFTAIEMQQRTPTVLPAFPIIRLDSATVAGLDGHFHDVPTMLPPDSHHRLLRPNLFLDAPTPLYAIFRLETGLDNNVNYMPFRAALTALTQSSYPVCLFQPGSVDHLRQCGRLVGALPLVKLTRRYTLRDLPEQAQMVEELLCDQRSTTRP